MFNLDAFSRINRDRARNWHEDFGPGEGDWTITDWANAVTGEWGEACNIIKKIRRAETGHLGALDPSLPELHQKLADELADTFTYLDLLATYTGVYLPAAIVTKFNAVSEREGMEERYRP